MLPHQSTWHAHLLAAVFLAACGAYDATLLDSIEQTDGDAERMDGGADASERDPRDDAGRARMDASERDPRDDAGHAGMDSAADGNISEEDDAGCDDCCPADSLKQQPGLCGCDTADTDSDDDGTPDCIDACPNDEAKTAAGECGCGFLETGSDGIAGCLGLKAALAHRYTFDGSGVVATDSIGGADGTVVGTALSDSGTLILAGDDSDEHVDLPDDLLSSLENATFEVFITWSDDSEPWQRVLDFGRSELGEGNQGSGQEYLFFTPRSRFTDLPHLAFRPNPGSDDVIVLGSEPMPVATVVHIAIVFDDDGDRLRLFIDGALTDESPLGASDELSDVTYENTWLGRSQFEDDPGLGGTIHEFRIYSDALSDAQIETSYRAGPDPEYYQ